MTAEPYVLVVDDDPDALEMLASLVRSLDIPVQVAKDGIEALERIREQLPGFVILDLAMPRMDGFSVLGRLRLDPDKRNIPILVVTALNLDQEREAELRNVVLDVIRKGDLDLDEMGQIIIDTLRDA